jgi:hypothetical protein
MVLLEGARKSDGRSVLYAIGIDQDTGATDLGDAGDSRRRI